MEPDTQIDAANAHIALETLAWLIEDAFSGDPEQSLLASLRSLRDQDWTALPQNGGRTIADIVEHVAWCKWMYEDYAFGTASLRGDQPPLFPPESGRSHDELLAHLADGHRRWLASVRALAHDAELDRVRLTNWGEWLPTRVIIRMMIGHDFYHAGEINHLRALLQETDRWPYD
jgi:uncharacterized damage-inducible protein DinB